MKEEISKVFPLSELKKEDFNKLKKWKEEEYRKIRSDLELILEGQKINQKAPSKSKKFQQVYRRYKKLA